MAKEKKPMMPPELKGELIDILVKAGVEVAVEGAKAILKHLGKKK